jgi:hypothetical protein
MTGHDRFHSYFRCQFCPTAPVCTVVDGLTSLLEYRIRVKGYTLVRKML